MQTQQPFIEVTPLAMTKIVEAMKEKNRTGSLLRIGVSRAVGGCACHSEYEYSLSLRDSAETEDIVEDVGGLRFAVDRADSEFLRGVKLDYVDTPEMSGFSIDNPNVVQGSCGCGGH